MAVRQIKRKKSLMPRRNMPDNWVPPVPAWSADLGDSSALAIAYYGMQHHTSDTRDSETAFALLRHGPDAPEHIERGRFHDLAGLVNEVFVCYWRVPGTYVRFAEQSALARWLADDARLSSDVGVWVEAFRIPMTRFETLFSSQCPAGAARLTDHPMTGPIDEHGYWGGMRDRIPASNADELSSPLDGTPNSADGTELGAGGSYSPRQRTSALSARRKTGRIVEGTSARVTSATSIRCSRKA
jgi:aldoxime dehydratase